LKVRKTDYQRNHQIATAYQTGEFLTEHIAKRFGISRRRVQQIAKQYGIVRTAAEGSRMATPLKSRRRLRLR
jgi:DNA-binding transcriptional regulator LsrR (DeoR family)